MNTLPRLILPICCTLSMAGCPGNGPKPLVEAELFASTDLGPSDERQKTAVICPGDRAVLSWTTSNATSAVIDPELGGVSLADSEFVAPVNTTDYQLVAISASGQAQDNAVVKVINPGDNRLAKALLEPQVDPETNDYVDAIWTGTISPHFMTARAFVTHVEITSTPSEWPHWEFRHTDAGANLSSFNVNAGQGATPIAPTFQAIGFWEAVPYSPDASIPAAKGPLGLEITLVCRD